VHVLYVMLLQSKERYPSQDYCDWDSSLLAMQQLRVGLVTSYNLR